MKKTIKKVNTEAKMNLVGVREAIFFVHLDVCARLRIVGVIFANIYFIM